MTHPDQRARALLMRAHRLVNRPYYWYRPSQLALRLRFSEQDNGAPRLERAAWGSRLYCWPDPLGRAVGRTGVYDLIVAETLARLADPGESAVDAGANVGLMSSLLAQAVGPRGRVVSFEPHPLNFELLARNVALWRAREGIEVVEPRQAAVSSAAGTVALAVDPETFAHNKGTASLELEGTAGPRGEEQSSPDGTAPTRFDVQAVTLDEGFTDAIGVLKLDVERHEHDALRGAGSLLAGGLIRDVVFEEHEPPPTAVTSLLEANGYTVMSLRQGLTGPIVCAPEEAYSRKLWDPPALLATIDPARARTRLARRGWACLRSSSAFSSRA